MRSTLFRLAACDGSVCCRVGHFNLLCERRITLITLTRAQARQIRSVFRLALPVTSRFRPPAVTFQAGPEGLRVWAKAVEAAVEYRIAGGFPPERLLVPFELLADCEGRKAVPVTIEAVDKTRVTAQWHDGGIPQIVQYDVPAVDDKHELPALPESMVDNEPSLLAALNDAMQSADRDSVRYALHSVRLCGSGGRIDATDGRQILVQFGFQFPWEDAALMPCRDVFRSSELPRDQPVQIGKSDDWISLRVGPWTIHLAIFKDGRFPQLDDYVALAPDDSKARITFSPADAAFLADAVQRLPCDDACNRPLTVDVNGQVVVRASSASQPQMTDLVLTNSRATGEPLRFNTNRSLLARAMKLGFREVLLYGIEQPAVCREASRLFVWALLGKDGVLMPEQNAIRIESPSVNGETRSKQTKRTRNPIRMAKTKTSDNGAAQAKAATDASESSDNGQPQSSESAARGPIEQAIELRDRLRDAANQTNELVRSLKRQKKNSQLVQSTLASLKQLQTLDA